MAYIIKVLSARLINYLTKYRLDKKWLKVKSLLESSLSHPSLHFKKVMLKGTVFYSFRLDKKYRGICIIKGNIIEIILFTDHYK
ncbi:MAG: hypothetical protein Q8Q23_04825 [bacterium]|nr:hypothetical protein [bacterium]